MPKYVCMKCGSEAHGRILHTLKACHCCGEPISQERVDDAGAGPVASLPEEASPVV